MAGLRTWHCLAILAAMACILFREILLGTGFFWEDFLYQNYPFRVFAATSLAAGELPLWNPYTFSGMPFLADIQTAVFYLPMTALTLAASGGQLHFYWLELVIVLHVLLAGAGMYALGRSFGMERFPALVSGAAYMLSGFMLAHAIHQQIITLAAWFPVVLLLFRRTLRDARWHWVFLTGLALGHSTLAGFPQLTLFLYLLLFAFFVFELLTEYPPARILSAPALHTAVRAAAVIVVSVAIAALQLLPTLELSPQSQRAEITYDKSTEGSLSPGQLLTLFYPKFFGTSDAHRYAYHGPGPYWHYWETCVYLGILPLLLATMALALWRQHRYVPFFAGVFAFAMIFGMGSDGLLHRIFYEFVPGFRLFRNPARMGVLAALAASILSGFTVQFLNSAAGEARTARRMRLLLLGAGGTGLALWLLTMIGFLNGVFPFLRDAAVLAQIRPGLHAGLLFVLLTTALLLGLLTRRVRPALAGAALLALFLVDMLVFGGKQVSSPMSPEAYHSQMHPLVSFLKEEGEREIFRVNARTTGAMLLDRNQGMIDRIFMMEGYTPLVLQRANLPFGSDTKLFDLLNVKYKTVREGRGARLVPHPTYLPRAFFVRTVRVAKSEEELLAAIQSLAFHHRSVAIIEKDPSFTLAPAADSVRMEAAITRYANTSMTVRTSAEQDGFLVLGEMFYPGWVALVDGAPTELYRTDYNLRGLYVPAGQHQVEIRFEPASFRTGLMVSSLTLLLCAAGIVFPLLRPRRTAHPQPEVTAP
jgi:hypothetical protein